MSILINYKICDNDKACSGSSVCPNNVFSWNEEKQTLEIDNSKCTSCGLCEKACMVSAIKVAKNDEEYRIIEKEYADDERNINDLLVDRYGAKIIDLAKKAEEKELEEILDNTKRPLIVELFSDDSIMCLLKSISIKEIANVFDNETRFRKIEIKTDTITSKYEIKELPALLFFRDGNLVGKYEGYIEEQNKEKLFNEIKKMK